VRAAPNPIRSAAKVGRFFTGIYSRPPWLRTAPVHVNAAPALLVEHIAHRHVLIIDGDRTGVRNLFILANPDKLTAVPAPSSWPPPPWQQDA
jgi:hypothetical protein